MTSPIELGLNLPYVEGSMDGHTPRWADIVAMARTAESIGFDAVWVSDHLGFDDPDGDFHGAWECWTLLAALAASTTRVELGVGAGWNEPEFTAYDVPFDERFTRFEDGLRVIVAMLHDGGSTSDARTISTHSARIDPRGPRPAGPPIMVGAAGPRMLRLTAELADQWNAGLCAYDEVPTRLADLDAALRDVGRDAGSITRSVEVRVRTSAAPPAAAGSPIDREIRGDPATIATELRRFAALGIDHLQVQLIPNSLDGVEAFAPVIEALRR